MALYVVNANFGEYACGEYVTAEPALVSDWVEAQFLSEVDDEGNRLVAAPPTEPDAAPGGPVVFTPAPG